MLVTVPVQGGYGRCAADLQRLAVDAEQRLSRREPSTAPALEDVDLTRPRAPRDIQLTVTIKIC